MDPGPFIVIGPGVFFVVRFSQWALLSPFYCPSSLPLGFSPKDGLRSPSPPKVLVPLCLSPPVSDAHGRRHRSPSTSPFLPHIPLQFLSKQSVLKPPLFVPSLPLRFGLSFKFTSIYMMLTWFHPFPSQGPVERNPLPFPFFSSAGLSAPGHPLSLSPSSFTGAGPSSPLFFFSLLSP